MFPWWKKKVRMAGDVLFRGELPRQPNQFTDLQQHGISLVQQPESPETYWKLTLKHPQWGEATLACFRHAQQPPRELFEYCLLSPAEKAAAQQAETHVTLWMEAQHGSVLRDRKMLLRYLNAVMGDDGLAVIDLTAQNVWTRASLADELCHDADLDVEAIYSIHAVMEDGSENTRWLHTHGLSEAGGFDFDILEPAVDFVGSGGSDFFRVLAFAILEKKAAIGMPRVSLIHPRKDFRLVAMEQFISNTTPALQAYLQESADSEHRKNHAVLCEPEQGGLFGWLKGKAMQPARLCSQPLPDNPILFFSGEATMLMEERARGTYSVFRQLIAEFAEFEFPPLVKLGYRQDNKGEDEREHLWFEVHAADDDSIDATLVNAPYHIAAMKEGDRRCHSIDQLSDWTIMTPFSTLSPRNLVAARIIRAHREEILKAIKEAKS